VILSHKEALFLDIRLPNLSPFTKGSQQRRSMTKGKKKGKGKKRRKKRRREARMAAKKVAVDAATDGLKAMFTTLAKGLANTNVDGSPRS
jgi:hypothetical protein